MYQAKYADAYAEVYAILNCLDEEEYAKIPEDILQVFEKCRNMDYKYQLNEELDLSKQPMLLETRAILLNIFTDYLATPEQSKKIKKWLEEDRAKLERKKREKYSIDVFGKSERDEFSANAPQNQKEELPTKIEKPSIWSKIINSIKNFLGLL